jgi:pumilio family protein 6
MALHVSGKQGRATKKKKSVKGRKQWTKTRKPRRQVHSRSRKANPKAKQDVKKDSEVTTTRVPAKRGRTEENVTSQTQRGVTGNRPKRAKLEKKNPLVTMTRKERKEARRKSKGNYEMIKSALKMWENLRRHDLSKADREEFVSKLCSSLEGHMKEVIFKHDLGRVVQCCLKFGSDKQRHAICAELKDNIVELCKSKYSKFSVKRILKYSSKEQRDQVIACLYGNVRRLIRHSEAAGVVEYAYNEYANAEQRSALVEEFYGPQFALFKTTGVRQLPDLFKSDESKKPLIMRYLHESITPLLDKNAVKHSIVHRAMLDFFLHADPTSRSDMIELMHKAIVQVLHTKEGSRVAMICIWHGTPKDRKAIIKSFKTYIRKICMEEYGHLVMLAVFDSVDDTVLVKKVIIPEIVSGLDDITQSVFGRKVLHYLLSPRDRHFFHPDIIGILQQGDSNAHSKKEASVRWSELKDAISPALLAYVAQNAKEMLCDKPSSLLLQSVLENATGELNEAMEAVAMVAGEEFDSQSHVVCDPCGHLALKKLIQHDASRQGPPYFSEILVSKLHDNSVTQWMSINRGAFVIAR